MNKLLPFLVFISMLNSSQAQNELPIEQLKSQAISDIESTYEANKKIQEELAEGFDFKQFEKMLLDYGRKTGKPIAATGHELVKELTRRTYQALLDAEIEEHLGYAKHDPSGHGTGNARNGRGVKKVKGDFGEVEINPPRDRDGSFEPEIIKKRSSSVGNFSEKIISLYARGMTTREIAAHIEEMYSIEISESFVSRAVSSVQEHVQEWRERPLEPLYPILYIDGIRFNVRSENAKIVKKCFYTVLGVSASGKQDVLGLWIADNEGASFWLSVLTDLKARGVQDILIACVDGLVGLPEAIEAAFPKTEIQLCIVHQVRNCCKFVSYKDRKSICADMKLIYNAPSEEAALNALDQLEKTWGSKYPMVIKSWKEKWSLLTKFLNYPLEIRTMTYTTNAIEALHALLRKYTNNRRVFPNDEALFRLLFLNIRNLSKKWTKRQGWNIVLSQLSILFPDRINKFLKDNLEN